MTHRKYNLVMNDDPMPPPKIEWMSKGMLHQHLARLVEEENAILGANADNGYTPLACDVQQRLAELRADREKTWHLIRCMCAEQAHYEGPLPSWMKAEVSV